MTTRIGLKHDGIRISCIILDLYRLNKIQVMEPGFEHSRNEKDYGYRIKWGIEVLERLSRATILFILRGRGVTKKKKGHRKEATTVRRVAIGLTEET